MALATGSTTAVSATALAAPVKRFNLRATIAAADVTILAGDDPAAGLTTFPDGVTLPGVAGGPFFVTLSRTIPENP